MSELQHSGTPQPYIDQPIGSGRYRKGTGDSAYERANDIKHHIKELRDKGLDNKAIASALQIIDPRTGEPSSRALVAIEKANTAIVKQSLMKRVVTLRDKGVGWQAIADQVGLANESTARSLYERSQRTQREKIDITSEILRDAVDKMGIVDVGPGTELSMGTTATNKKDACLALQYGEGYNNYVFNVGNMNKGGQSIKISVLAKPDISYKDALEMVKKSELGQVTGERLAKDLDTGEWQKYSLEKPTSIDPKRVKVRYNEEGGVDMDGTIEIRRGCEDLSLGNNHYAQVRIAVDDTHYLKGMACYGEDKDFPPGVDIIFNTNKHVGTPMIGPKDNTVLKPMKTNKEGQVDLDNPFGSSVVQHKYIGKDGKEHLSALNIVGSNETDEHVEGSWNRWNKKISAQFLSKQDSSVAKRQLDKTFKSKKDEFDAIMALTNPVLKKELLADFAEQCDSDAVTLKAVGFPRQRTQVIMAMPKMPENKIYAPNFENGEEVALVRFPHAGTFEIPTLIVDNSKSSQGYKRLGMAKDAVGINPKVASILSGADFDGDTVVVIPTKNLKLKTRANTDLTKDLKELQNFEPKELYKLDPNVKGMTKAQKQNQMGVVSNLITDMTIRGASSDDIAKAVRHSMVVIDAEKHHLDYKQSEADNQIALLKKMYQNNGEKSGGASTLISRAKSEYSVDERKKYVISKNNVDENGRPIYTETGNSYVQAKVKIPTGETNKNGEPKFESKWVNVYKNKKGEYTYKYDGQYHVAPSDAQTKVVKNRTKSSKMAEASDAMELLSGPNHEGTDIERVYGNYANSLKSLANQARLAWVNTESERMSTSAKHTYAAEVESLKTKLKLRQRQLPYERTAQMIAHTIVDSEKQAAKDVGEDLDKEEYKKLTTKAMNVARKQVYGGEKKYVIDITPKEWEAIQAGAVSSNMQHEIFKGADKAQVRQYATPKTTQSDRLTASDKALIKKFMDQDNYTADEVAKRFGVSVSTVYAVSAD